MIGDVNSKYFVGTLTPNDVTSAMDEIQKEITLEFHEIQTIVKDLGKEVEVSHDMLKELGIFN